MNAAFTAVVVTIFFAAVVCQEGCEPPRCTYPDGCKQPLDVGPCKEFQPKYYFNATTKTCELFKWGGCCQNCNNFQTIDECKRNCLQ